MPDLTSTIRPAVDDPGPLPGERLADRLVRLADDGASGVLRVSDPSGSGHLELVLVDGRITAPGRAVVPTGASRCRAELALTAATMDVVTHLLLTPTDPSRATADVDVDLGPGFEPDVEPGVGPGFEPDFEPDRTHPLADLRPLAVADVLREVRRRRALLVRISPAVTPDTVPERSETLPGPRVRLSRGQWDLLRLTDGVSPVRSLAAVLDRALYPTVLDVHRLLRLGVLRPAGGTQPATPPARRELSHLAATEATGV